MLANLTLPSTSTSIAVGGLDGGSRYAFRAAAWTQVGLGPSSPAVVLPIEVNHSLATVPMTDHEVSSSSFPANVAQVCNLLTRLNDSMSYYPYHINPFITRLDFRYIFLTIHLARYQVM